MKFFNSTKGSGFIAQGNVRKVLFVYQSGLVHEINPDNSVKFDVEQCCYKGLNVVNATAIDSASFRVSTVSQ